MENKDGDIFLTQNSFAKQNKDYSSDSDSLFNYLNSKAFVAEPEVDSQELMNNLEYVLSDGEDGLQTRRTSPSVGFEKKLSYGIQRNVVGMLRKKPAKYSTML